jgi:hypothetical protein
MRVLVWIYRLLTLFLLFILAANTVTRFVALSLAGEVGRYLFLFANVLLFLIVLTTGLKLRVATPFVWGSTFFWCLLFCWWAWIERQSSPFILHELHTFDPEEARQEIRHFQFLAVPAFSVLLGWFASFPFLQRYASSRNRKSVVASPE